MLSPPFETKTNTLKTKTDKPINLYKSIKPYSIVLLSLRSKQVKFISGILF